MPQLLVEDAVKAYDTKVAVDHVSFEVNGAAILGAAEKRLRDAGVAVSPGEAGFAAQDPWGTRLRFRPA